MSDSKIRNAVIKSARLEIDPDRDILTVWLDLDYGGSGQGFGGYSLHLPPSYSHYKGQANFAGEFIRGVLDCAGARHWDDLPGKTIRADSEYTKVRRIGHIVEDLWFDPEATFERIKAELGVAA